MNAKQNWIKETENSLNHLNAVDVNPYLYSKIINKLIADSSLNDLGRGKISGIEKDNERFKVPGLRNIEMT
jgi:hypothetical protein